MKTIFEMEQLPLDQFRELGLIEGDRLLLPENHIQAMLAGRRTDFIRLEDLSFGADRIPEIDVKLSLSYVGGEASLNIHPVYKEPKMHPSLTDWAKDYLIEGEGRSMELEVESEKGKRQNRIFEYDPETNEFLSYAPSYLFAPEQINQSVLNMGQKARFRKGEWVLLDDGTSIQHRASDSKGLLSSGKQVMFSVKEDKNMVVYRIGDLKQLFGDEKESNNRGLEKEQKKSFEVSKEIDSVSIHERNRGYNQNGSR
ncbi:DUF4099 domain-containing protein [Desertivirga brevis]|uniref:DUF4099 domain-containing protein n=1 Tax=Desertivirga brevis TaxID=2810310 RepID=UPI001A96B181|nr:DUF4099 domain-containing protein [Pedobacter sp. SYSU D00873]